METVLSFFAIIISIGTVIFEYIRELKFNRTNLEAIYYTDIYKEHLVYGIPNARKYIKIDINNQLIGTDKLINELQKLRQDSLYFQYSNIKFYEELCKATQTLEDFLVENTSKFYEGEEQTKIYNYIQNGLNEVYRVISSGYLGKYNKKSLKITIE